jgi:hypothetical protein
MAVRRSSEYAMGSEFARARFASSVRSVRQGGLLGQPTRNEISMLKVRSVGGKLFQPAQRHLHR